MDKKSERSFIFSNVHIDPKHQIDLHRQHSWELSYVMVGSGIRTIGDTTEPFKCGEVVLIPPEIPHCWQFDEHDVDENGCIANITLMIENTMLDNCAAVFPELDDMIFRVKSHTDALLFSRDKADAIIPVLQRMNGESDAERLASVIRILIVVAASEDSRVIGRRSNFSRRDLMIDRMKTYIVCNARRTITIDDMAAYVGMNRSSFCIFFKRVMGKSFVNYLNEYRIRLACEHLHKQETNISEICYQSGFNDIPYFNRLFKRIKGVSPREYRATYVKEK